MRGKAHCIFWGDIKDKIFQARTTETFKRLSTELARKADVTKSDFIEFITRLWWIKIKSPPIYKIIRLFNLDYWHSETGMSMKELQGLLKGKAATDRQLTLIHVFLQFEGQQLVTLEDLEAIRASHAKRIIELPVKR